MKKKKRKEGKFKAFFTTSASFISFLHSLRGQNFFTDPDVGYLLQEFPISFHFNTFIFLHFTKPRQKIGTNCKLLLSPAPNMSLKEHDVLSIAGNIPKDREKYLLY